VGYLSRICRGKGVLMIPEIIVRLIDRGWRIERLVLCGAEAEAGLVATLARSLSAAGVALDYRGALSHRRALDTLYAVDAVIFPSVSSFESAGRVSIEAVAAGKVVIGAAYCSNAELIVEESQIPLAPGSGRRGSSAIEFEIAVPDFDAWQPPSQRTAHRGMLPLPACYRSDPTLVRALLHGDDRHDAALSPPPRVRLDIERFITDIEAARDWCAELADRLVQLRPERHQLIDLGGAAKRAMLDAGYCPAVSFTVD
jgi:hypothetical protein